MAKRFMSVSGKNNRLIFGAFLLISINTTAQIDLDAILSGADQDDALQIYQAQLDFLTEENLKSPWFHRFELRTRSDDFNASPEDYRLRLGPVNPAEIRANKQYFDAQKQLSNTKYNLALNEALIDRYQSVINWLYLWNSRELMEKDRLILEDILEIYRSSVNSLDFDYDDYLDTEKDKILLDLEIRKVDYSTDREKLRIREIYGYAGDLDTSADLISIDGIRTIMEQNSVIGDSTHLKLLEAEQELLLAGYDFKVGKAKNRRNIGYFQVEYDDERGNEFNEHMGFQVGIRLPLFNPDRPDLQRDRLDLIDDRFDAEKEQKMLRIGRLQSELKMNYLLSTYDFFSAKVQNYNESMLQTQNLGDDPMIVLKNIDNFNRLKKKLLEIEADIYFTYIDLLDLYGVISQKPLRNYLSEQLNLLD